MPIPRSLLAFHCGFAAFLVFPALFCSAALAATYQVGPGRTHTQLTTVAGLLNPGDTVLVDGGATYNAVTFSRSGSQASPIVVIGRRSASGARALVSGGTNTVHLRASWYVVQGLEITGGASRCVFHEGADNLMRDVLVHDCPKQGILGADQGSGNFTLEYSEVYHCGGGNPERDHQIYMTTDQVRFPGSVFRMRFCYLHDGQGGNNVKSRSERNEIHYNWIEGAHYHELELIGPDPGGVGSGWTPRLKREDSDVVGNVFRKTGANADFSVFRVGGDATGESHGRYRFVNNTVIAGNNAVFRCFDSLESVEMHNNVFLHRSGGTVNMTRVQEAKWVGGTALFAGSNNWVQNGAQNLPAQWTGTRQGSDPGFVNFAALDLRPAPNSPLINGANASLQGPPGATFPNPLFPPAFSPPQRQATTSAMARAAQGALDIGAYEENAPAGIGISPRRWLSGTPGPAYLNRGQVVFSQNGAKGEARTLKGRKISARRGSGAASGN